VCEIRQCVRRRRGCGERGRLTVGQPVSAMYIFGLLLSAAAGCTFCSLKKSAVHPAASSMDTLANHGCTFDICATQGEHVSQRLACTYARAGRTYAVVDVLEDERVEVAAGLGITNLEIYAHAAQHLLRVVDVLLEDGRARVADGAVRVRRTVRVQVAARRPSDTRGPNGGGERT
jgi:hypothetical protein